MNSSLKHSTSIKQVMCESHPNRREELDKYMSFVIDLAGNWPGFCFYQYHLEFSARAAEHFERGSMVDWGVRCQEIFITVTAGKRANSCALCSSYDHQSAFCHLAAERQTQSMGQGGSRSGSTCNYYNNSVCHRASCPYLHACSNCRSTAHKGSDPICPRSKKGAAASTNP